MYKCDAQRNFLTLKIKKVSNKKNGLKSRKTLLESGLLSNFQLNRKTKKLIERTFVIT